MHKAKVTSKGQITLPSDVRKALGIKPGDKVVFLSGGDGEFRMRRMDSVGDLFGVVKKLGYAYSGSPSSIEEMKDAIAEQVAALDEAAMSPEGRRRARRTRKTAA